MPYVQIAQFWSCKNALGHARNVFGKVEGLAENASPGQAPIS